MGSVTYSDIDGDYVHLEIDFQDARRSRTVEKTVQRSEGGAMEVLKHRADTTWTVTFEPVNGTRLQQLRQFLDATEGGEPFSMDPYGTASAPLPVRRVDDGYSEDPFMRNGSRQTDYFVVSIQVIEV